MSLREILGIVFRVKRGRMSKDSDPRYLANGDFTDALNNRVTTTAGGSTGDRESVLGNELSFTLPTVATQNKTYRIYIDVTQVSPTVRTINVYDGNGVLQFTFNFTPTHNNLATTRASFITAGNVAFGAFGQTYGALVTTLTNASGYFTLQLGNYLSGDFTLTLTGAVDEPSPLIVGEAIDTSMQGQMVVIGSYDLQGLLYVWSTNQHNLPTELNVTGAVVVGSLIFVQMVSTATITDYSWVVITGVQGAVEANGGWIAHVIDATHIQLINSPAVITPYTTGGTVTVNSLGLGEVGIALKNENDQTWRYFTLIRSRTFNFRTKKQPKTYCEQSATKKSLYWTDDYNVPRVLYDRTVSYQNNALLTFVDPLNTYAYETLNIEDILILSNTDLLLTFTGQDQSGGNLPTGNSRYTIRLKTETNTFTDWIPLSNPIPSTVDSEQGSGWDFFGNNSSPSGTPKVNNFRVQGSLLGIFTKIQLARINYLDSGTTGLIVSETTIPSNDFSLSDTGFQVDTQDLDVGTLAAFQIVYTKAKNIDSLAGELILSNLETTPQVDLSDYFSTLPYSIERVLVPPSTGSALNGSLQVGEYQESMNLYAFAGYMLNERVRTGFVVEWRTGGKSPVFFGNDIVIDRNAAANKTVNIADYNICLSSGAPPTSAIPYAIYFRYQINPNAIVNGIRLKDLVKRIYVMRCPIDTPQVIASGIAIPAVSSNAGGASGGFTIVNGWSPVVNAPNTNKDLGEFPFVAGIDGFAPANDIHIPLNYAYGSGAAGVNYTVERHFASLYFPDQYLGSLSISPNIGTDKILNFGQPKVDFGKYAGITTNDYLLEAYDGFLATAPPALTITEAVNISKGGVGTLNAREYSKKFVTNNTTSGTYIPSHAIGGLCVYISASTFVAVTANTDNQPIYYIQYYRPIANADDQYGQKVDSVYMWTGAVFDCDGVATSVDVFGGDVVNQKVWMKDRYPVVGSGQDNFGQGFGWYNQCRINYQMRTQAPSGGSSFPTLPVATAVQRWLDPTDVEGTLYNRGYNVSTNGLNTLQLYAAFNPDPESVNSDFPVRIAYSQNKIPESAQDSYRVFLPLNFKDLDYKNGEIFHHAIANGELITWQVLCLMHQYFDSTGMLRTTTGTEVILGDAGKLQRRGTTVTTYGTKNGFSVMKGKTQGGNDAMYWIDTTNKAFFRLILMADGTVNLGIVHGMDSWFENNLRFVDGIDTPADGQGICSTWNERNKEAIVTARGWKQTQAWSALIPAIDSSPVPYIIFFTVHTGVMTVGENVMGSLGGNGIVSDVQANQITVTSITQLFVSTEVITGSTSGSTLTVTSTSLAYTAGAEVTYGVIGYEQIPSIWISLENNNGDTPNDSSTRWTQIAITDSDFYNVWTLAFNEYTNGFDLFYSFKPKVYLPFKNTYLSPKPIENEGGVYEHGRGNYSQWYATQIIDGTFSFVINLFPDDIKRYLASRFRTLIIPSRVDVTSSLGMTTFMLDTDYILREGNYDAAIKNDLAVPQGKIIGDFAVVKLTFKALFLQRFFETIFRVKVRPRNPNS